MREREGERERTQMNKSNCHVTNTHIVAVDVNCIDWVVHKRVGSKFDRVIQVPGFELSTT